MKLKGKRARIAWYFPYGSGEGDRLGAPKLNREVNHPSTDLRLQFLSIFLLPSHPHPHPNAPLQPETKLFDQESSSRLQLRNT